jgi:hypothetical protein
MRHTDRDKPQPAARTHLFTVRVWLEELRAGQTEWRGEVHEVVSGEVRYFRDWPTPVALVQAMLPQQGGAGVPSRTINKRFFRSCRRKHLFSCPVLPHHNAMPENEFVRDLPEKREELFCST